MKARFRLSAHPSAVALGPRVWVADFRQGTLWRIDPAPATPTSFRRSANPRSLAILGGTRLRGERRAVAARRQRHALFALTGRRIDSVESCPAASPPETGSSTPAGCPNIERLSTGARQARRVHERPIPFAEPLAAESFRQIAVRPGHRRGRGVGDRRRARPSPLQDRAALGGRLLASFPSRSRRSGSPPAQAPSGSPMRSTTCCRGRSGERPDRAPHRDVSRDRRGGSRRRGRLGRRARSTARSCASIRRAAASSSASPSARAARGRGGAERGLGDARCALASVVALGARRPG